MKRRNGGREGSGNLEREATKEARRGKHPVVSQAGHAGYAACWPVELADWRDMGIAG